MAVQETDAKPEYASTSMICVELCTSLVKSNVLDNVAFNAFV